MVSHAQDQNLRPKPDKYVLHSGCLYRHQRAIEADRERERERERERPTDPQTSCQISLSTTFQIKLCLLRCKEHTVKNEPNTKVLWHTGHLFSDPSCCCRKKQTRGRMGPRAFQGWWCINASLLEGELVLLTSLI